MTSVRAHSDHRSPHRHPEWPAQGWWLAGSSRFSFPAIDGDTLIVGAGAPGFDKNPHFQLIAYSLS
jgi:hypothetical protein